MLTFNKFFFILCNSGYIKNFQWYSHYLQSLSLVYKGRNTPDPVFHFLVNWNFQFKFKIYLCRCQVALSSVTCKNLLAALLRTASRTDERVGLSSNWCQVRGAPISRTVSRTVLSSSLSRRITFHLFFLQSLENMYWIVVEIKYICCALHYLSQLLHIGAGGL